MIKSDPKNHITMSAHHTGLDVEMSSKDVGMRLDELLTMFSNFAVAIGYHPVSVGNAIIERACEIEDRIKDDKKEENE